MGLLFFVFNGRRAEGRLFPNKIDDIFECIKTDNSAILSTLKAYRMPLPIASLIIKKIIKITLEHK